MVGEGEHDLVFLFGWPTHLALMWENPAFADLLDGLSTFSRLVLFDRLGNGMSDRGPTGRAFEDGMDGVRTVLRAAGSARTAFFGCHLGGRLALLFAATHPQQVSSVVTFGAHPATLRDDDYPWGTTPEDRDRLLATFRAGTLDTDGLLAGIAPSEAATEVSRRWWSTFFHSAATPPESIDEITSFGPVDIRGLLGSVHTPTLVLHRTGDRVAEVETGRYLAARLPQARLVELPGDDHLPFAGDQESVLSPTQEFLTGRRRSSNSTAHCSRCCSRTSSVPRSWQAGSATGRWRLLLEEHDRVVREALARFGGREIDTAGDVFLVSFDGPARGHQGGRGGPGQAGRTRHPDPRGPSHRRVRAGRRQDPGHRGARRGPGAALADAGEILCSRTVKELVAGSGFAFTPRGTHRLKGVPDEWQLYRAELV